MQPKSSPIPHRRLQSLSWPQSRGFSKLIKKVRKESILHAKPKNTGWGRWVGGAERGLTSNHVPPAIPVGKKTTRQVELQLGLSAGESELKNPKTRRLEERTEREESFRVSEQSTQVGEGEREELGGRKQSRERRGSRERGARIQGREMKTRDVCMDACAARFNGPTERVTLFLASRHGPTALPPSLPCPAHQSGFSLGHPQ